MNLSFVLEEAQRRIMIIGGIVSSSYIRLNYLKTLRSNFKENTLEYRANV